MGTRAVARINGLKGGRPKGSKSTPQAVKDMLQQILYSQAEELAAEHLRICLHGKFEPTRLQGIKEAYDRMLGKPPQPHDGDGFGGSIVIQVMTGVPRDD